MIEIRKKLKVKQGVYQIQAKGAMELSFEQRCWLPSARPLRVRVRSTGMSAAAS